MCLHYHLDAHGRLHPCSMNSAGMSHSGSSASGGAARQQQEQQQYGIEQSNMQLGVMVRKGVGGTCPLRWVWDSRRQLAAVRGLARMLARWARSPPEAVSMQLSASLLALFAGLRLDVWRPASLHCWMACSLLKMGCRLPKRRAQLQRSRQAPLAQQPPSLACPPLQPLGSMLDVWMAVVRCARQLLLRTL